MDCGSRSSTGSCSGHDKSSRTHGVDHWAPSSTPCNNSAATSRIFHSRSSYVEADYLEQIESPFGTDECKEAFTPRRNGTADNNAAAGTSPSPRHTSQVRPSNASPLAHRSTTSPCTGSPAQSGQASYRHRDIQDLQPNQNVGTEDNLLQATVPTHNSPPAATTTSRNFNINSVSNTTGNHPLRLRDCFPADANSPRCQTVAGAAWLVSSGVNEGFAQMDYGNGAGSTPRRGPCARPESISTTSSSESKSDSLSSNFDSGSSGGGSTRRQLPAGRPGDQNRPPVGHSDKQPPMWPGSVGEMDPGTAPSLLWENFLASQSSGVSRQPSTRCSDSRNAAMNNCPETADNAVRANLPGRHNDSGFIDALCDQTFAGNQRISVGSHFPTRNFTADAKSNQQERFESPYQHGNYQHEQIQRDTVKSQRSETHSNSKNHDDHTKSSSITTSFNRASNNRHTLSPARRQNRARFSSADENTSGYDTNANATRFSSGVATLPRISRNYSTSIRHVSHRTPVVPASYYTCDPSSNATLPRRSQFSVATSRTQADCTASGSGSPVRLTTARPNVTLNKDAKSYQLATLPRSGQRTSILLSSGEQGGSSKDPHKRLSTLTSLDDKRTGSDSEATTVYSSARRDNSERHEPLKHAPPLLLCNSIELEDSDSVQSVRTANSNTETTSESNYDENFKNIQRCGEPNNVVFTTGRGDNRNQDSMLANWFTPREGVNHDAMPEVTQNGFNKTNGQAHQKTCSDATSNSPNGTLGNSVLRNPGTPPFDHRNTKDRIFEKLAHFKSAAVATDLTFFNNHANVRHDCRTSVNDGDIFEHLKGYIAGPESNRVCCFEDDRGTVITGSGIGREVALMLSPAPTAGNKQFHNSIARGSNSDFETETIYPSAGGQNCASIENNQKDDDALVSNSNSNCCFADGNSRLTLGREVALLLQPAQDDAHRNNGATDSVETKTVADQGSCAPKGTRRVRETSL